MVGSMKTSILSTAVALLGVALTARLVLLIAVWLIALALLTYAGIALPAIWSASPARRRAAANVLREILRTIRRQ
jgi:hypothetical protein